MTDEPETEPYLVEPFDALASRIVLERLARIGETPHTFATVREIQPKVYDVVLAFDFEHLPTQLSPEVQDAAVEFAADHGWYLVDLYEWCELIVEAVHRHADGRSLDEVLLVLEAASMKGHASLSGDPGATRMVSAVKSVIAAQAAGRIRRAVTLADWQILLDLRDQTRALAHVHALMERTGHDADYAPGVTDTVERLIVGCQTMGRLADPAFKALMADLETLKATTRAADHPVDALRRLVAAMEHGTADLDAIQRHFIRILGDYAPGVVDVKARLLHGLGCLQHHPLTKEQWTRFCDDSAEFIRQFKIHLYARQDGLDLVNAIDVVLPDLRAIVEPLHAKLQQQVAAYARGPIHLVALEQQFLSYRVNKTVEDHLAGLPGALQPATVDALRRATCYCWSPECVEAVHAAATGMPSHAKPTRESLGTMAGPAQVGWWWFEQPIPVESTSTHEPVVALLWRREVHDSDVVRQALAGTEPTTYRAIRLRDPDDPFAWARKPITPPPQPQTLTWFSVFVHEPLPVHGREQLVPTPTAAWFWADDWTVAQFLEQGSRNYHWLEARGLYGADRAGHDVTMACAEWFARFWLAAGHWLQKRVLTAERTTVPRQPGRALAREHGLDKPPLVEIVHLRKGMTRDRARPDAEPRKVDWQWRWLVGAADGGFWRDQYHPSTGEHVPTWIDAYWKGPEDRPIKTATKVYAVIR
jgi:hypothetical protein